MSHLDPRHHTATFLPSFPPFLPFSLASFTAQSGIAPKDRPHRLYNLQRVGKGREGERESDEGLRVRGICTILSAIAGTADTTDGTVLGMLLL